MSAFSKLLRIVSQQKRMAALAYGQAISRKENLERDFQSKQTAITRGENNLSAVMCCSGTHHLNENNPVQTMQALAFHQCELVRLKSLIELTRKELATTDLQIHQLRKNYEAFHSRQAALEKLIEKDEQKRRAKRIHNEQTNLDEITVQRWGSQTV